MINIIHIERYISSKKNKVKEFSFSSGEKEKLEEDGSKYFRVAWTSGQI